VQETGINPRDVTAYSLFESLSLQWICFWQIHSWITVVYWYCWTI